MKKVLRKLKKILAPKINRTINYKKQIEINIKDNEIVIKGIISRATAKKLLIYSRANNQLLGSVTNKATTGFKYTLDLNAYSGLLNDESGTYDLYFEVEKSKGNTEVKRLGKFNKTMIENQKSIDVEGHKYYIYTTIKGNVTITHFFEKVKKITVSSESFKIKKHQFEIEGYISTKNISVKKAHLYIVERSTLKELKKESIVFDDKKYSLLNYGDRKFHFQTVLPIKDISSISQLDQEIYDVFLEVMTDNNENHLRFRLGNKGSKNKKILRGAYSYFNNKISYVTPYYTVKQYNLSLQLDQFATDTFIYMKRMMRWSYLIRWFNFYKNIWIVGERPYKAQDTGYHFFKYMRENYPNKKIYYVIEKESPELRNIEKLGNVLFFKSKSHIKMSIMARKFIGSHHADYIFPTRSKDFQSKIKAKRIFLQHGVLGTKNISHFYGKSSPSFHADLFIVSSEYEKKIVENDFGYNKEDIAVTGIARFDSLLNQDTKVKKQILIIPTWREWLVNEQNFINSEYLEKYKRLIFNEELHQLSENYNFDIIFCLHPNMQNYTKYFQDAPVKVISQGEIDVQRLMKESMLMVTDYSSVAFDFSFLNRPVLYYQFDQKRFLGKKGSHLNLDTDLPGEIVYEEEHLIHYLKYYAENNFNMRDEYKKRAKQFLKYSDTKSSERIYRAIKNMKHQHLSINKLISSKVAKKILNKFRKSRFYFPTMKLFYKIARKILPLDEKLIVFESGIGKQYADSPRYIYEELIKKNKDFNYIWIYNKKHIFKDQNTKKIKRLSPQYYYYLAKAKYWVNNQNFPTYIIKPKKTIYLQTWHGTPLKKMLLDIENVQGRSDDYVERVYNATKTWDYLISPSQYASQCFKSAFGFKGEILELGYPRNDLFYKKTNEVTRYVKEKLKIPQNKKIVLYAPTFRDNQTNNKNKFIFDINLDLESMMEKLGDEYVLLLRAHVVVSNKLKISKELKDFVFNVSNYPEIQELCVASDILITDYSSVMFDFANSKKPMIFYTFDLETYRDNTRGFYMDFEKEAPGPLVFNTDEVIENILDIENVRAQYEKKYQEFYDNYCYLEDGTASSKVVDKLFD